MCAGVERFLLAFVGDKQALWAENSRTKDGHFQRVTCLQSPLQMSASLSAALQMLLAGKEKSCSPK